VVLLTRITAQATDYYLQNIGKLPKEDYISFTYEEFCQHPQETLENIMERLSVTMRKKIDAASMMSPRKVDVDASVQKLQKYIYTSLLFNTYVL
jgi:hypothetical protein